MVLQGHTQGCWQVIQAHRCGLELLFFEWIIRDCPGELRGDGWSSSGAGARTAWKWPQDCPQPWNKGLQGQFPPSCFIHTVPNKHPLPLGFSPLKCHQDVAQQQGQGSHDFHRPRTKFLLLKMNVNILQMFWIYLYKELLPSGHVFWVVVFFFFKYSNLYVSFYLN